MGFRPRQRLPVATLPREYLHLIVGRESTFARPRQMYGAAGGPMELRYVTPAGSTLLGVWYRAYDPAPALPPVLTLRGRFRGSNTATTTPVDEAVADFLVRTIGAGTGGPPDRTNKNRPGGEARAVLYEH